MKKLILLSAFVLTLAACSTPAPTEVVAPVDSTCVAKDSTCMVPCDSVKVDSVKAK